ncbi:hypothetical protein T492DRAFT_1045733, partial [Pavlovales sp. CCMP2436]
AALLTRVALLCYFTVCHASTTSLYVSSSKSRAPRSTLSSPTLPSRGASPRRRTSSTRAGTRRSTSPASRLQRRV